MRLKQVAILEAPQAHNGTSMQDLVNAIRMGVEIAKAPEGGNARLLEIFAAKALAPPQSEIDLLEKYGKAGLIAAPGGGALSELAARVELAKLSGAREDRREQREVEHRHKLEERQELTASKLVDLGAQAVSTIAKPISEAVGANLRDRRLVPGMDRPGGPPDAANPGQLSPQEQLGKLEELEERVREAKARILGELGVADPLAESIAKSMQPPPETADRPTTEAGT